AGVPTGARPSLALDVRACCGPLRNTTRRRAAVLTSAQQALGDALDRLLAVGHRRVPLGENGDRDLLAGSLEAGHLVDEVSTEGKPAALEVDPPATWSGGSRDTPALRAGDMG